jgi:ribonuclease-3
MKTPPAAAELLNRLGYTFRNEEHLLEALSHRSWANESRRRGWGDNERLEFLGDAVLGLAAARFLTETFPEADEGELSRRRASLVGERHLEAAARSFSLGKCLMLGRGEERSGGREKRSILADAMEALVGAVYRDGGWRSAYRICRKIFTETLSSAEVDHASSDAKTRLQEICQERYHATPVYRVLQRQGPDHKPWFSVETLLDGAPLAVGEGAKKKDAEQAAAAAALKVVAVRKNDG